jgi:Sulfotransferase domain
MRPPAVARAAFHSLSPRTRGAVLRRLGYFAPWEAGFDLRPPDPAPGERSGPPDFVGIGVQKAGTSWWYELIVDHPRVFARPGLHKERHYFSHFGTDPFGPAQVAQYHGWFPRPPGRLTGEWTPDYLGFPWVAPLLSQAAPEARLLVLLRDPVERFRSGLDFRLSNGAPDDEVTVADAVRQGFYARSLRTYLDHYPAEQLLVLQYEACAADPAAHLGVTYDFLGLDAHRPADLRRTVNVSAQKRQLDADTVRRLVDVYHSDVEELVRLVPTLDLGWWPHFATAAG